MAMAVLSGAVDIDHVMGMLHGRDGEAALGEFGDQPLDQRRLAGIFPADDTIDIHAPWNCRAHPRTSSPFAISSASARSSGVLTLKKRRLPSNTARAQPWREVQTITLRILPSVSAYSRSSARSTGQSANVGCSLRPRSGSSVAAMLIG